MADQRKIIAEVYQTNAAAVPQLWALYKEVQEYYEKGMRVPDDVTLLWCDDNWGNIRRLPTAGRTQTQRRRGHLLSLRLCRRPAQLQMAQHQSRSQNLGADEPGAITMAPTGFGLSTWAISRVTNCRSEFFLSLAWNPEHWPKEKIAEFTRLWAEREFGPEYAARNRRYLIQIHKVQWPAQTGVAGSGRLSAW